MPWPGVIVFVLPPGPVEVEPILFPKATVNTSSTVGCTNIQGDPTHLSLICLAIVKNACSTLVALFAEVSRKGMFSWSANSYVGRAEVVINDLVKGERETRRTFATVYSTTFFEVRSDLLPTSSLLTPSEAYRSISWSHCFTLVKVSVEDN